MRHGDGQGDPVLDRLVRRWLIVSEEKLEGRRKGESFEQRAISRQPLLGILPESRLAVYELITVGDCMQEVPLKIERPMSPADHVHDSLRLRREAHAPFGLEIEERSEIPLLEFLLARELSDFGKLLQLQLHVLEEDIAG